MPYGQPKGTKQPIEPVTGTPGGGTGTGGGSGSIDTEGLEIKMEAIGEAIEGLSGIVSGLDTAAADPDVASDGYISSTQVLVVKDDKHYHDLHLYGTCLIMSNKVLTIYGDLYLAGAIYNQGLLEN